MKKAKQKILVGVSEKFLDPLVYSKYLSIEDYARKKKLRYLDLGNEKVLGFLLPQPGLGDLHVFAEAVRKKTEILEKELKTDKVQIYRDIKQRK